jgi:hypothetical protein
MEGPRGSAAARRPKFPPLYYPSRLRLHRDDMPESRANVPGPAVKAPVEAHNGRTFCPRWLRTLFLGDN